MRSPLLRLWLLTAVPALAQAPKIATAVTKYGPFKFFNIEIIRVEADRPCGFSAKIENHTGTNWDHPLFSIKVSGLAPDGKLQSFEIEAQSEFIGTTLAVDTVAGKCITDLPAIAVRTIEASLVSGEPDLDVVRRNQELAKLPTINAGSTPLFVAADRKCAEEFQRGIAAGGLEGRKRISELAKYGCGFITDGPARAEILRKDGAFMIVKLANGEDSGKSGWVPAAWVK
jgi:hypothetical protein